MNPTLCIFFVTLLALAINIPTHAGNIIGLLIPVPARPFEKIARRAKHFPQIKRCTFVPEETIDEETDEQIAVEQDTKKALAPTQVLDIEIDVWGHLGTHCS